MNAHLPEPSAWPFTVAGGVTVMAFGVPTHWLFCVVGLLVMAWGIAGWIREMTHE